MVVDPTAADRFIRHALSDAMKAQKEAIARGEDPHTEAMKPLHPVSKRVLEVDKGITEVGMHTRFSHVGDSRRLQDDNDEDDELAVVGEGMGDESAMDVEEEDADEPVNPSPKQKGKRKAVDMDDGEKSGEAKPSRKRTVADPFAGKHQTFVFVQATNFGSRVQ